jgi:hypothetical protein
LQASILLALKPNGRGLTVVGERESTGDGGRRSARDRAAAGWRLHACSLQFETNPMALIS